MTDYHQTPMTLLKAVRWFCRPLVKLLIAKGITYPLLRDLFKELYVEVAEQDFILEDKPPTNSRIYILTGVHRKDIKRLRNATTQTKDNTVNQLSTLGGNIVSRWLGLPDYQDAMGQPRCLPRASNNNQPGFDELVASVSKDVRPRVILDEWLRLGMVSINDADAICLNKTAFIPQKNFEEQVFFLGRNVHDHLAACVHNMQQTGTPMLERSVYFAHLSEDSVRQLRVLAEQQGMALLQTLNEQALELQNRDKNQPDATQRMRFGCYWYQENKMTAEEPTK